MIPKEPDSTQIAEWKQLRHEITVLIRLQRHSRSFNHFGHHAVNAARARDEQLKKVRRLADRL